MTTPRPAMSDALLSIGDLARRTGLTVRTLHHYDAERLVVPSVRTDAGHRRYAAADVARLQQVTSLRALGLPLAAIRALLDGPDAPDALSVVERHLAHVRARLAAEQRLADRLDGLARHLRLTGPADADALLTLIHLTAAMERHYTPEQLDQLKARAEAIGQAHIDDVQNGWAVLFADLDRLHRAGTPPDAPEAQALAARARGFIAEFTGGDAGLERSLNNAVAADKAAMYAAWGIAPDLGAYYDAVMTAGGGS